MAGQRNPNREFALGGGRSQVRFEVVQRTCPNRRAATVATHASGPPGSRRGLHRGQPPQAGQPPAAQRPQPERRRERRGSTRGRSHSRGNPSTWPILKSEQQRHRFGVPAPPLPLHAGRAAARESGYVSRLRGMREANIRLPPSFQEHQRSKRASAMACSAPKRLDRACARKKLSGKQRRHSARPLRTRARNPQDEAVLGWRPLSFR